MPRDKVNKKLYKIYTLKATEHCRDKLKIQISGGAIKEGFLSLWDSMNGPENEISQFEEDRCHMISLICGP